MKISIVTVCFNSADTIRDTIESVLSQTYEQIDYIIVDGGSTDGTIDILNEHTSKVDKILSEPDKGIYDAMNKGIKLAVGDYVGFLNSDDVFFNRVVIADMVSFLKNNREPDGVYADLVYVQRNNINKVTRLFSSKGFSTWKIRFGFMCPHPTFYVKRNLFDRYGLYSLDYRVAADFELMARFLTNKLIINRSPKLMVKMREGGISSNGFWWRIHQNFEIVRACRTNGIYTNILFLLVKIPFKFFSYLTKQSA